MADTTARPAPSSAWDPATNPRRDWARLRQEAYTDEQRACIAAATRQADRMWVALHSGLLGTDPVTQGLPPRNAAWHRLALSEYELLRESRAYGHLAQLRPWACAAAEPVLAAWLSSPASTGQPGLTLHGTAQGAVTVAQCLGVGEAVNLINGDTEVAHLSTLLRAAQDAAVFGVPRHRVELVTAGGDHDGVTVVRVVVDTPHGLALASEPLQLGVLIDRDRTGVPAATAALCNVAQVATNLFTVHGLAVWEAPPPIPTIDRTATAVGRAFPELSLHHRPAAPVPPTPSPAPSPAVAPRPAIADGDHPRGSR